MGCEVVWVLSGASAAPSMTADEWTRSRMVVEMPQREDNNVSASDRLMQTR